MESLDEVLMDAEEKMEKATTHLHQELAGLRTGKAATSLVDNVAIEYYGAQVRLREIALISTPEPRLIVIKPHDPTSFQAIEKGIMAANIGITPMSDGRVIRIPIPELSEERRKELLKVGKRMAEEQRVAIRNVRRDGNEHIKKMQKDSVITEDEKKQGEEDIQKLTDQYIKKVDDQIAAKEKDILAV